MHRKCVTNSASRRQTGATQNVWRVCIEEELRVCFTFHKDASEARRGRNGKIRFVAIFVQLVDVGGERCSLMDA